MNSKTKIIISMALVFAMIATVGLVGADSFKEKKNIKYKYKVKTESITVEPSKVKIKHEVKPVPMPEDIIEVKIWHEDKPIIVHFE